MTRTPNSSEMRIKPLETTDMLDLLDIAKT